MNFVRISRMVGKQEIIRMHISASSRGPQTGLWEVGTTRPLSDHGPIKLSQRAETVSVTAQVASRVSSSPAFTIKHLEKWLHPGIGTKRHQKGTKKAHAHCRKKLLIHLDSPSAAKGYRQRTARYRRRNGLPLSRQVGSESAVLSKSARQSCGARWLARSRSMNG